MVFVSLKKAVEDSSHEKGTRKGRTLKRKCFEGKKETRKFDSLVILRQTLE